MDRRTARVLIGALALCCLALVAAAVYPFTAATPHAEKPADERFTVPESDEYRATGAIVVDGETALKFESAVATGGGRYQFVDEGEVRTEQYQASSDGPVYERLVVEIDGSTDRLREQIRSDTDSELLRENRTGETVTFILKRDSSDIPDDIAGTASVVVRSLYVIEYEGKSDDTQEMDVYGPKNGWYEGGTTYRVTGATGEVRTAPDSTAVQSATVTWDQTSPAGTYAEFALVRLTSDAPRTYDLSFEFDPGETTVKQPAWVTAVRTEA